MRTTASISLLAALGLLSLSTATTAQAAPAKIGVKAVSGGVTVKVANPNRYAIKGSVTLVSGARKVAAKNATVRAKRSASLSLSAAGRRSVTVVASFGRPGAKPKVTRQTVTVGSPSAPATGLGPSSLGSGSTGSSGAPSTGGPSKPSTGTPSNPPGNGGNTGTNPGGNTGTNPPPPNYHWTGTDLTYGGDFGFTVKDGLLSLDQKNLMLVTCYEGGGNYRWAQSYEVLDEDQNWPLGNQTGTRYLDAPRANQYSGSSPHRVTYKITSQLNGSQITGKISQSFAFSRYDFGKLTFWNCSGSLDYSAVQ